MLLVNASVETGTVIAAAAIASARRARSRGPGKGGARYILPVGRPFQGRRAWHPIVQQEHAQRHREQIEEGVVARERDERLQTDEQTERELTQPARSENEKRRDDLDREHRERRELVEPRRQLMRVPRGRRRNRLRLVVVQQRSQRSPRRIAARELHQSRSEHQAKEQPQHQPARDARWRDASAKPIAPRERREEDREEPCLEEQRVPLVRQELAADDHQRQIVEPEERQHHDRSHAGD
jgi:hypothetical protein